MKNGFFQWLLIGFKMYQESGNKLVQPLKVKEATRQMNITLNEVGVWAKENLVTADTDLSTEVLLESYAQDNGTVCKKKFKSRLELAGYAMLLMVTGPPVIPTQNLWDEFGNGDTHYTHLLGKSNSED